MEAADVRAGPAEDGAPRLYVGEADVLGERLKQHVAGKEFWTRVVAFTSTNEGLNKADVRYLESRLIELAKRANQWAVENGTTPGVPPQCVELAHQMQLHSWRIRYSPSSGRTPSRWTSCDSCESAGMFSELRGSACI